MAGAQQQPQAGPSRLGPAQLAAATWTAGSGISSPAARPHAVPSSEPTSTGKGRRQNGRPSPPPLRPHKVARTAPPSPTIPTTGARPLQTQRTLPGGSRSAAVVPRPAAQAFSTGSTSRFRSAGRNVEDPIDFTTVDSEEEEEEEEEEVVVERDVRFPARPQDCEPIEGLLRVPPPRAPKNAARYAPTPLPAAKRAARKTLSPTKQTGAKDVQNGPAARVTAAPIDPSIMPCAPALSRVPAAPAPPAPPEAADHLDIDILPEAASIQVEPEQQPTAPRADEPSTPSRAAQTPEQPVVSSSSQRSHLPTPPEQSPQSVVSSGDTQDRSSVLRRLPELDALYDGGEQRDVVRMMEACGEARLQASDVQKFVWSCWNRWSWEQGEFGLVKPRTRQTHIKGWIDKYGPIMLDVDGQDEVVGVLKTLLRRKAISFADCGWTCRYWRTRVPADKQT